MTDPARRAIAAALKMLGRRDHFGGELSHKLRLKGHDEVSVVRALERCTELGLIDDRRVAVRFVEIRSGERGWGPARLRAELRARGVDGSLAESAARLSPELHDRALSTAVRKAETRLPATWWRGREGRARMVSSLVRRGFGTGEACRAVDRLAAEREAQHHEEHDQPGDS